MAATHDVRLTYYDGGTGDDEGIHVYCNDCGDWDVNLGVHFTPGQVLAAYLDHVGGTIGVRYNHNVKMTRGKTAMHAVYATLRLLGVPSIRGGSVVVLGGNNEDIEAMPVQMRENFRGYAAGATWLDSGERM